jgi:beta-phosphoglucomutase-like phosphatase (HAD superfamily)
MNQSTLTQPGKTRRARKVAPAIAMAALKDAFLDAHRTVENVAPAPRSTDRELAVATMGLSLWLCWHSASPREVIPHILRELAGGECSDEMVEAISDAASRWTRKRFTYHRDDADVIVRIAKRKGGRS